MPDITGGAIPASVGGSDVEVQMRRALELPYVFPINLAHERTLIIHRLVAQVDMTFQTLKLFRIRSTRTNNPVKLPDWHMLKA